MVRELHPSGAAPSTARAERPAVSPRLRGQDHFILGALAFFIVMATTIEAYYVFFFRDVTSRSDFFALAYRIYSAGDDAYYGGSYPYVAVALEAINVFFSQFLNVWLIFAILKRRSYRHVLQLALSAYLSYSVVLYFTIGVASGFSGMATKNAWGYFIYVAPNLPWLLIYLFMTWDSSRYLVARLRTPTFLA